MMQQQKGSTLIAVLIILLVITILGVMAIRQGLTSLTIATNSQVQSLLTQSSDVVFTKIQADYLNNSTVTSIIGFSTLDGNEGKEWIACYRPTTQTSLYNLSSTPTAVIAGVANIATVEGSTSGFCDLTMDFTSKRNAVVTQLAVMVPNDPVEDARPFEYAPRKTDTSNSKIEQVKRVRVYATSIVPSMSNTAIATVQSDCMRGRISDDMDRSNSGKETVTDCLAKYGVPANTQVQEYQITTVITQEAL
jgi:Tfp pilus assembly protein PilX